MKYKVIRATFAAGEATITPKAQEYTVTIKFYGADTGAFPASTANTSFDACMNELRFTGGEETRDFSCAMDLQTLERIIKQGSGLAGSLNLKHPSNFLKKYQSEGPLVSVTVLSNNATDASNDQSLLVKGLMKLPDMAFLSNPGTIDFEIVSYGQTPLLTVPSGGT